MNVRHRNNLNRCWIALAAALIDFAAFSACNVQADDTLYVRDLKPILKTKCYSCHGAIKQEGGLRLDTAAGILAGGDNGPAVQIGVKAESHRHPSRMATL